MKNWTELLRSPNGGLEINRVVGFFGGLVYVVAANLFVGYEVFWLGKAFDITAYCLAFPAGLSAVTLGTAGAVAIKDRNVATAQVVRENAAGPAGTDADPVKTEIVNTADNPANVQDASTGDERPSYAL